MGTMSNQIMLDKKIQRLAEKELAGIRADLAMKKLILEQGEEEIEKAIVRNGLATVLMKTFYDTRK